MSTGPPRTTALSGLRIRIVAVMTVLLVPGFLLVKVASDRAHGRARDDAEETVTGFAGEVADREADLVESSRVVLGTLTNVPEALVGGEPATCPAFLRRNLGLAPEYLNIAVFGHDGTARCSARPLPDGYRATGSAAFTRALASGEFAVGRYLVDSWGPRLAVAERLPDAGGDEGSVVMAWIDLGWVDPAAADADLPGGSVVAVVADDGTILARHPDPEGYVGSRSPDSPLLQWVLDGRSELTRTAGLDGVERLVARRSLSAKSGAHVYVGIPVDAAYAEADAAYRRDVLWLGGAALAMFAAALVLSEVFLLRPIRRLRAAVQRIGAGDLSARSDVPRTGEIGDLARAFDEMATQLAAREREAEAARGEMEQALAELERSQRALKRMLGALVTAQEEERRRIAGEVHDDAVQAMTANLLGLQLLRRRLAGTEHVAQLEALEQTAAGAIDRLRHLLFDLHTPVLDYQGLAPACEALLARTFEGGRTMWNVDDRLPDEPPEVVRTVAYRIAQEAIVNAHRHADASRVDVSLAVDDGTLVVTVRDDGRGFAPDAPPPGHFGIETMQQRAALAGGEVAIASGPGRGTEVRCCLPLGNETRAAWVSA